MNFTLLSYRAKINVFYKSIPLKKKDNKHIFRTNQTAEENPGQKPEEVPDKFWKDTFVPSNDPSTHILLNSSPEFFSNSFFNAWIT